MIRLALLAPAALLAGAAAVGPTVAVVEVREAGRDGTHLVFPVPLAVARGALAAMPDGAMQERGPSPQQARRLARAAPAIRQVVAELRRTPDAELVRVLEDHESVSIRKVGAELRVRVRGEEGEDVRLDVPLAAVERLVESYGDGRLTPREIAAAMGSLSRGRVIDVQDGEDRVRVWLY